MFKITKSTSPKDGKAGRLQICEINGEFSRVLVDIETTVSRPYKYILQYKTGKLAKAVRQRLIESGLSELQCDVVLRTGLYDPRNGRKRHATPQQLLSEQRSLQARAQHAIKKSMNHGF